MRLPSSFELAYWVERDSAKEVEKFAEAVLRTEVCHPNRWLFAGRVKDSESALARLELGPVKSLAHMRDLYGATVVVPTRNEISPAIDAIIRAFPDSRIIKRKQGDAATFVYDDVHVIAHLGARVAVIQPAISGREFEVQVRTGLQFAWWRATHDVLYKGEPGSWRLQRLASQTRATLELLDTTLANLRAAANLLDTAGPDADADAERRARWTDDWPTDRRPRNLVRFAEGAGHLLEAANLNMDEAETLLLAERAQELRADDELTPFQVLLAIVVEARGVHVIQNLPLGQRVLVTDELLGACPAATDIPGGRRARPAR